MGTTLLAFEPSSCSSSSACPIRHTPNRRRLRSIHRRGCRKLGFRREPPRCSLAEPSLSDSLFLAAAAALAALGVAYASSTRKRRRDPTAEFSDTDISGNTFGMEDGYVRHNLDDQELNFLNVRENEMQNFEVSSQVNMVSKKCQPFSQRDEVLEFESTLKLIPKSHVLHSQSVVSTEPSKRMEMEENREVISTCVPQMLVETRNVEQDIMKELLLENQYEGKRVSVFTDLRTKPSRSCIISQAKNTGLQMIEDTETAGESQVATSIGLLKHPIKNSRGLDTEAQISHRSIPGLQNQSQITREFSLQDNAGFNSSAPFFSRRPQIPKGGSAIATDKSEEPMPPSSGGVKEAANLRSLPSHMNERLIFHRKSTEGKNKGPMPNKITMENVTDASLGLSLYNRLLREGRLNECLDLLENMETKDILDMDKVYHARFLRICREQKAVAEAFRFTKLIKNPTLSTYNMLLSVCAASQIYERASQVLVLVKDAGLRPDCQLYTTLISTCGKSGKVNLMFEVFHEMVNAGVEPNLHTYGALIDGCARAGQVAKAFGAYGIMRSKNVKPDRVIFNALITACGQSGAVDRAFDVLAEMIAEPHPIDPDHVTVGALIRTCTQAGQADRACEVYQLLQQFKIKGTADVYTIAVNSCSLTGNLDFALSIYDDMTKNGIVPDEMFLSTIVDVAGHAGKVAAAFDILKDAKLRGLQPGIVSYSSLMGTCSKTKSWQKALELYEEIKSLEIQATTSTMNALITCLCDSGELLKAVDILGEMREAGVHPNTITYSVLISASEKKSETELAFDLLSQAKEDGILLTLRMCQWLTGLCMQRYEKAYALGEPTMSFDFGTPQIGSKWTKLALALYRETISSGLIPSLEVFSQVLGCLKYPNDISLKKRFVESLGTSVDSSRQSNLYSLLDGFGEYDPRAFSLCEEASSLGVVPCISFKDNPLVVDARKLRIHVAEVYILTILESLKHRLAAGAILPNMTILLPIDKKRVLLHGREKTINLSARVGQAVAALLRRLGLPYQGDESRGKIQIKGLSMRRWFEPKIEFHTFGMKLPNLSSNPSHLQSRFAREIATQQRSIRNGNFFHP